MPDIFASLDQVRAALEDLPDADPTARAAAEARNGVLTKPAGALGRLEALGIWLAGWQGTARPRIARPQVLVCAGNHGVAARGVSAYPAEVTQQMLANFAQAGAAVNQIAGVAGAEVDVLSLDLDRPTADFTQAPAMTEAEVCAALSAGWAAVRDDSDVLVPGEMGIGNTTAAAAVSAALFGGEAAAWASPGTGVDAAGVRRKAEVVATALAHHSGRLDDPLQVLRCLGGRELAGIAGAVMRARHLRRPVILDGYICTAAAAVLAKAAPGALDHCVAGHLSDQAPHKRLLAELGLEPLLDLGMRLGEGSGGALAIPILRAAAACLADMASFEEAGVSAAD